MTVLASAMMPRLGRIAPGVFTSLILCASLLVTACGGNSSSDTTAANPQTISPAPGDYTLTVSKSGSGSVASSPSGINCGSSCSASYASGTSVTLTASAATGYSFAGWSGACSGSNASCTVSMTQARSVSATFAQNSVSNYTLSVSKSGSGSVASSPSGINCGTTCSASYVSGTSVTLTASPASGYSFSGWSGACSGSNASCTVSMTQARSVSASFTQNVSSSTYILSWDAVNNSNVTGYKIYYATAPFSSGPQVHSIDVGPLTSYEVTASSLGVSTGTTVYFAVTAVGTGAESPLSTTVSGALQ